MNIEYEATFTNINKDQIRAKLKEAGVKLVKPEFLLKRTVFNTPKKYVQGEWIRVRDEGNRIAMTYKNVPWGDKNKIEDQKEIEIEVSDYNLAVDFLKNTGCIQKSYQENNREVWELDETEICIDSWPYLEPYIEVEGPTEESVKKASLKLGFDYTKAKFCAADQIYHEKYGTPLDIIDNHTPIITFHDPNPFI